MFLNEKERRRWWKKLDWCYLFMAKLGASFFLLWVSILLGEVNLLLGECS